MQVLHIIKKHSGSKEPKDANGQDVKAWLPGPSPDVIADAPAGGSCVTLDCPQVTKGRAKLALGNIRKKFRAESTSIVGWLWLWHAVAEACAFDHATGLPRAVAWLSSVPSQRLRGLNLLASAKPKPSESFRCVFP